MQLMHFIFFLSGAVCMTSSLVKLTRKTDDDIALNGSVDI